MIALAHDHIMRDVDKRFIIDTINKTVIAPEHNIPVLSQYDHNSEYITFESDRHVEGHDLLKCDKVEVHYNNTNGRAVSKGLYEAVDLQVDPNDATKVVFTWAVSEMATQYAGKLNFIVSFVCTDEGDLLYRWNTRINSDIRVSDGINNTEYIENTYADVLAMWKQDLFGIGDTEEARMLALSESHQEAIANKGLETLSTIPDAYSDMHHKIDDMNLVLKSVVSSSNLYNPNDFDENGYFTHDTGEYASDMIDYGSSGFIPVKENIRYYQSASGYVTFWDSDKEFIGGQSGGREFVPPVGCSYVNCALLKSTRYTYFVTEFGNVNFKMLDSEVDRLSDYFSFETNNLYDSRLVGEGCYDLNGQYAYIDDYGSFTIPVNENEKYIKSWSGYIAYFDSKNDWIRTDIVNADVVFTVPTDAVKMNVAVLRSEDDFWLLRDGENGYRKLSSEFLPDSMSGLKYGALGDSITYGLTANTCYGKILSEAESITFLNYGISGNRVADNDDEANDPMYIRYTEMSDELDIVTVFGGTNDCASQTPIGTNSDETGETFKGALNILCRGLLGKYVGKRLGFITPIQRNNDTRPIKLIEYVDAIKEICGLYAIPVLDLYNTSTITCAVDDNSNGLLTDGLHPSDAGHAVLARKISNFIKTL